MKYRLKSVRIKLDSGEVLTQKISGETNDLAPLRRMYRDLYGAESVLFVYEEKPCQEQV